MPYHVSTLLESNVVHAEAYMTRKEAERKALMLTADKLRLGKQQAERLQRSVLELDEEGWAESPLELFRYEYTYRVDRCANPPLCMACLEADFDQAKNWPRRGTAWGVYDCGTHIEILRQVETQVFEDDEQAAAFVVMTAQNPGTPEAVRRECQLALGEIIFCNSQGIEAWRRDYSGSDRWQEIFGCGKETEDVPCECMGKGFLVMNEERYEPEEALGEIQACDCGIFETDEDAIEVARAAGYTVTEEGIILSKPCRLRARRRWGA